MTEAVLLQADHPGVEAVELTEAEAHQAFDVRCRELLGVTREQFLSAWHSGAYEGDDVRPDVAELIHLAPFAE